MANTYALQHHCAYGQTSTWGSEAIALMPKVYRLWTKLRKNLLMTWDEVHRGPWDERTKRSKSSYPRNVPL